VLNLNLKKYMLTWLEISKLAIKHNLGQFRKLLGPKIKIMAIVKSNAYGHGMIEVGKIALKAGADWLGVINLEEALKLKKEGIKAPIFILSYWDISEMRNKIRLISNFDFPVYTFEQAKILSKIGERIKKTINIHLKIDTGTSRIGLKPDETVSFVKKINKLPRLYLRGIFTHYASSENKDQSYTNWQTKKFEEVINNLTKIGIDIPLKHAACSAATIINPKTRFNLVRIGIAMYGLWPSEEIEEVVKKKRMDFHLKPALSWKTKIIQVKELPPKTFIGYDCTYQTKRKTKIAVLPIGYWEGYDRKLSGCGEVLIHGQRCPVRGRVCMNLTMVEVTKIPNVKVGDEVVLIGKQNKEEITADELAEKIGTINYEIVTRINSILPRIYK
jgi:alanine racemase